MPLFPSARRVPRCCASPLPLLSTAAAAESALSPPRYQKWPAHDGGTSPREIKYCAAPARVRLHDAILPTLWPALQYPVAAYPRSARVKIGRKKKPLRAAEIQIPSASLRARIGPRPP